MRALFVVNERAGRRRTFDVADVIRRATPFEYEIAPCREKDELDGLADRAEREGFDVLYAVGGDGTVHETAKRLVGRRIAMGILPIGSGNGLARHLGIPMDPDAALKSCAGGRVEAIDTATAAGRPFPGVMGLGFDAEIAHRFAAAGTRGLETYFKVGLAAFWSYRPQDYALVIDGVHSDRRAAAIVVANSAQYGNGARIAPRASLTDGLLDVVVIEQAGVVGATVLVARIFTGTLERASGVSMVQAKAVTIRRAAEGPAHLDGEPVTLPAEIPVTVVPSSLRVLVPEGVRI